jgi:ketosteroid isomerase-like protein
MQPRHNEANNAAIHRNKTVARRMLQMFNDGDLRVVDEIASPNVFTRAPHPLALVSYIRHPLTASRGAERRRLQAEIEVVRAAFENLRFDEEVLLVDEDGNEDGSRNVFMSWRLSGTNTGPLGSKKATGKHVTVLGADIMRLDEDSRIVEHIDFYTRPRLDLLYRLGLLDVDLLDVLRDEGLLSLPSR